MAYMLRQSLGSGRSQSSRNTNITFGNQDALHSKIAVQQRSRQMHQ
jgi:hypothetical protein